MESLYRVAMGLCSLACLIVAIGAMAGCGDTDGEEYATAFAALDDENQGDCYERCAQEGVEEARCEEVCDRLELDPCFADCTAQGVEFDECRLRCFSCYSDCVRAGVPDADCRVRCAEEDAAQGVEIQLSPEECMSECLEAEGTDDAICTERCAEVAAPPAEAEVELSPEECMDECLEAEGTDQEICTERCAEEG